MLDRRRVVAVRVTQSTRELHPEVGQTQQFERVGFPLGEQVVHFRVVFVAGQVRVVGDADVSPRARRLDASRPPLCTMAEWRGCTTLPHGARASLVASRPVARATHSQPIVGADYNFSGIWTNGFAMSLKPPSTISPKLFQNLRSTRETELAEQFPMRSRLLMDRKHAGRRREALPSDDRRAFSQGDADGA